MKSDFTYFISYRMYSDSSDDDILVIGEILARRAREAKRKDIVNRMSALTSTKPTVEGESLVNIGYSDIKEGNGGSKTLESDNITQMTSLLKTKMRLDELDDTILNEELTPRGIEGEMEGEGGGELFMLTCFSPDLLKPPIKVVELGREGGDRGTDSGIETELEEGEDVESSFAVYVGDIDSGSEMELEEESGVLRGVEIGEISIVGCNSSGSETEMEDDNGEEEEVRQSEERSDELTTTAINLT